METIEFTLAANAIKSKIDQDRPLDERLRQAFTILRDQERDVFFMGGHVDNAVRLNAGLSAVYLMATDTERDRLLQSVRPLRQLNSALQATQNGLSVDFSMIDIPEDLIPIMRIFREVFSVSQEANNEKAS